MKFELIPMLLPKDSIKRTGALDPRWITIHETSLGTETRSSEYNFEHYYKQLLKNDSPIGYHYLIEANYGSIPKVYQFIENTVSTHHTGNDVGNAYSIGIERLVNQDTDFQTAINVQAMLSAQLMKEFQIPIHGVVPHMYWSGKECPARLLAGMYGGWDGFIDHVWNYFELM